MGQQPTVKLVQQEDYRFAIHFSDELPPFIGDEPPPLGRAAGPSPAQLLAAAVANCLSDSLLFALRKFKQSPEPIETIATCQVVRNAENRLRILAIDVELSIGVLASSIENLDRVLAQFQDFYTVSSSINPHIPVHVTVKDISKTVIFKD
ncbi:MAG: OsmC family protein [Polynucleobacter victoriensis]